MERGHVSRDACRELSAALAMRALGRDDHDPALDAHLEDCADCRGELAELRRVANAIVGVDPERVADPMEARPALATAVVGAVRSEIARHRRRRWGTAIGAAAAAIVIVVAGVLLLTGDDGAGGRRIEFAAADVRGSASLIERAWGTEVALDVSGLSEDEVYWLWLTGADDRRVAAGTITGTGGPVHAVFAASIDADAAVRIWMTDESDAVVFDERLD